MLFGRRVIITAVDAVVNDLDIFAADLAHNLRHAAAVRGNGLALADGSPQNRAGFLLALFEPSGDNISHQGKSQAKLGAERHKRSVQRAFPGEEINVGRAPEQVEDDAGGIGMLSPTDDLGVLAGGYSHVGRAGAEHDDAEARRVEPRDDLFHREVLGVGIALVGKRRGENRNHALSADGMSLKAELGVQF